MAWYSTIGARQKPVKRQKKAPTDYQARLQWVDEQEKALVLRESQLDKTALECPICLDEKPSDHPYVKGKCGHRICIECYNQSLEAYMKDTTKVALKQCPMCRRSDYVNMGDEQRRRHATHAPPTSPPVFTTSEHVFRAFFGTGPMPGL